MSTRLLALLIGLAWAAPVAAQPAPQQFTKVTITSTIDSALKVGCISTASAAASCTGGIWAGPQTLAGILTVNGGGVHTFSANVSGSMNEIRIRNTSAANGSETRLRIGTDTSISLFQMIAYSSGTTPSGRQQPDAALLLANGSGGLTLASDHASGAISFYTVATLRGAITNAGVFDWTGGGGALFGRATGSTQVTLTNTATAVIAGAEVGIVDFLVKDDGNTSGAIAARVVAQAAGTHSGSSAPTGLWFYTTPSGSTTAAARLQLRADDTYVLGSSNTAALRSSTEGTRVLTINSGTAPVGTTAPGEMASFYVTSGEMYTMDKSGNATLLSPHDDETNEVIFLSHDTTTGKVLRIDTERLFRAMDAKLGGGYITEWTTDDPGATVSSVRPWRIAQIGLQAFVGGIW